MTLLVKVCLRFYCLVDRVLKAIAVNVNVRGPCLIMQETKKHVPTDGSGRVVLVSSVSARGGYSTQTTYGATKAAVEHLARAWATEFGRDDAVITDSFLRYSSTV